MDAKHNRINASNPCSEYMFLDDTACNLASINIARFYTMETDSFDLEGYLHAIGFVQIALERPSTGGNSRRRISPANPMNFGPPGWGLQSRLPVYGHGAALRLASVPQSSCCAHEHGHWILLFCIQPFRKACRAISHVLPQQGFHAARHPQSCPRRFL